MDGARAEQSTRSARWAPLAAAVAVVAVVAVVATTLGGRDGSQGAEPPVLRLGAASGATEAAPAMAGDSFFTASSAVGGGYRLEGELPSGGPERGAVHRPTSDAGADDVRRLAAALGIEGEPLRDGERWTVRNGDTTLDVSDEPGQPWWYGQAFDQPMPVEPVPGTETGGSAPACAAPDPAGLSHCVAIAPPPDLPVPEPTADPVSEDAALELVRPMLAALDLDDADVRTEAYGDTRAVTAAPRVASLPTQGWEARFEVGPDGALRWASGMLSRVTAGEEYPLLDAQEAFDLLTAQPQPEIAALCAPDVPCGPGEQVVTGAEPGLQLHVDEQGPLLVPAWLFTVRDAPQPVGQVAVEPAYLAPPVYPDAPEPDAPMTSDPVPADPGAPVGRTAFPFDRAARAPQETAVIVGYGDSGSCPHTGVVPRVEETDEVVTVTLESDATPPDQACTADYIGVDLTVPLERPLGDRALVDGTTGVQHDLP